MKTKRFIFALVAILLTLSACTAPFGGGNGVPTGTPLNEQEQHSAVQTQIANVSTQAAVSTQDAIPTYTPTATLIPPTATLVPTNTPEPAAVDYGVTCWPEDINVKLTGTGDMGLRQYIQSKSTPDGKLYRISRAVLNDLAVSNNGMVFFEGRPAEANGVDDTYVYAINTTAEGDFVYQNGTFYFQKKSDQCPLDDNAVLADIDRILMQKWESRRVDNEGAGLKGFNLIGRFYDTSTNQVTFNLENPYKQITTYTLNGLNTCDDLTEPRRTDYQGEQHGEFKNFYFGGPNCRSMAIGTFQADAIFTQSGYMIRLYKGAMDNQMVLDDGTVASFMFPTSWSSETIVNWLTTYFAGVKISDPENILGAQ